MLLRSAIYSKTLMAILKDLGEWEPCCLSAMVAMVAACVLYVRVRVLVSCQPIRLKCCSCSLSFVGVYAFSVLWLFDYLVYFVGLILFF